MLTYTFTKREKTLILVLAIVLVVVAWYMLVFQNTTDQVRSLESQTVAVEEETTVASAKVAQMNYMKEIVAQRKAEGVKATPIPEYDNMQPLMARLDSVMAATEDYQLSFGELELGASGYVMRPVNISFTAGSYAAAESVVQALAQGPYPCVINTVAITDTAQSSAAGVRTSSGGGSCSAAVQVTFFEKNDGSFVAPTEEGQQPEAA